MCSGPPDGIHLQTVAHKCKRGREPFSEVPVAPSLPISWNPPQSSRRIEHQKAPDPFLSRAMTIVA